MQNDTPLPRVTACRSWRGLPYLLLLVFSPPSWAAVIDNFDLAGAAASPALSPTISPGDLTSFFSSSTTGGLGNERDFISVSVVPNLDTGGLPVLGVSGGGTSLTAGTPTIEGINEGNNTGVLAHNQDENLIVDLPILPDITLPGAAGLSLVTYDGADQANIDGGVLIRTGGLLGGGLGDVDLTEGGTVDAFQFRLLRSDLPLDLSITMVAFSSDLEISMATIALGGNIGDNNDNVTFPEGSEQLPLDIIVPFADFAGADDTTLNLINTLVKINGGGPTDNFALPGGLAPTADFGSINAISLLINGIGDLSAIDISVVTDPILGTIVPLIGTVAGLPDNINLALGQDIRIDDFQTVSQEVPEPGMIMLILSGLAAVVWRAKTLKRS